MTIFKSIGKNIKRKDGRDKVTGKIRYVDDFPLPGMLYTAFVTSPHAHAGILGIDSERAREQKGVLGVYTGEDFPYLIGLYLGDKPPLARDKVRHYGEPVAVVVALEHAQAKRAAKRIRVTYDPLPIVSSPKEALKKGAPLLHEKMADYTHIPAIFPEPGTNIGNRTQILKGDTEAGFKAAHEVIEENFSFPPGDHVFMEDRIAIVEITGDHRVIIRSSTQSPFSVQNLMSRFFDIPQGKITVIAPPVGGGFGGKAGIQLEPLAYLLSKKMKGRPVRVAFSREEDFVSAPGSPGLEARVRLGAAKTGKITAADIELLFDSGGYADYAVNVSRAAALASSGPYRIDNLKTEALCVYTNHPFATAYRGFGHIEMTYALERAMDILAEKLRMDPFEIRRLNAIQPGDTTPTQNILDKSTGDLKGCLDKVAERICWSDGVYEKINETLVRAKGIACFWKAPAIPTNTQAGAIITFNMDGSLNLSTGAVEIGQGTLTGLAQIVAEKFNISPDRVHVTKEVITNRSPQDWTTAASRTLFMAGRASLMAADDAIAQIKNRAMGILKCPFEDLSVSKNRVFIKDEPETSIFLGDLVNGYTYADGTSVGGPVIGRGHYISRHLTHVDPKTGEGRPGLEWTMGATGVELEVDLRDGSHKILTAACAMDVGCVINPDLARGQVVGALAMGIGYSTKEAFEFDNRQRVLNSNMRDFKILRYGEQPTYFVDFLTTPQQDGPHGARGLGEHGIIGVPGALAAAFSRAVGVQLTRLPITPEYLWRKGGIK
jgi:CO/xanthine dehydrogenase Mo-binding subunit